MYENNNKAIVKKLAKRSIKTNRMRNVFAVLAIILTTVLFTTVFTIGISMVKSIEYSIMRQVGSSDHGGFKYLTTEEYEIIKKHKTIKEYGITVPVALAENPELAKRQIEISYIDENGAKYRFISPLHKGNMPKRENEIVLDTITLDMLGLGYELGQDITLDYSINGKDYSKKFVLTGYYEGDIVSMASSACVSKEFIEKNLSEIDQKRSKEDGSYTGTILLDVMLNNKFNIEEKLLKILYDSGFEEGSISYGINWAYMGSGSSIELSNIIPLVGLLLLIMLSGYLIIYNLFYISVVKDIRFYGLLKTIGTTSSQLKRLIIKQAMILSFIGVPFGLAMGYLVGIILLPYVLQILTFSHSAISINPIIFVGSALFSIITVLVSCHKPARYAAKTSPMEAVRYTGLSNYGNKKTKKSGKGVRLYKMAFSNVFRNKKKAFVVIVSLSLSMILLNSVYTIVSGFDMDKYLSGQAGTDFTIGDATFYRWRFEEENSNAVTEELCNEIEQLAGVEGVGKLYNKQVIIPTTGEMELLAKDEVETEDKSILEGIIRNKEIWIDMYGIDNILYPLLNEYIIHGEFDDELFKTGNYAVIYKGLWDINIYDIGDKINILSDEGQNKEYTIMAIVDRLPLYMYSGKVIVGAVNIYIPSEEYTRYTDNISIMTALFNVEDEYIPNMDQYIQNKIKEIPTLDYRSKAVYEQEYNDMVNTYNAVGYTLSLIIGLIGILNFINVMITSIISRRQEFATMQSIGMTNKQLRKMLIFEGLYYALITFAVVLVIGIPIIYFGVNSYAGGMSFFSYHFTILPIFICMPILIVISGIIPALCFTNIKNISVVERLREIE
ncbi:ABC transporter permease [Tissierella pigra]|uniref:FtsX-like permease family protein n=1 Tax=Tissierella pigra TaxID=2607614 RepID=A0A6N7XKY3_9FIRM|nr:FtsX-like permease family protein [Tissierella pigra]MSU02731.1 FtsX-like permease family protein [Tissierella pigra]